MRKHIRQQLYKHKTNSKKEMLKEHSSLSDFEVLSKLGEGAFGQVYRVRRKLDSKEYAMKKVRIASMKAKERDNALNQIRILASYEGEHIVRYKEAFYDELSSTLCIVMEFAQKGDLLKSIKEKQKKDGRFDEEEIWKALVHMTLGLKCLHERKILHRDVKSANIFLTQEGTYKLGDLNVSKVLKKEMAETQTGTPYYASPEVWKDKPYGAKSDMWSLGCVIYEMAALKPPFNAHDLQGLYRKVVAGYFPPIPSKYSSDLHHVIGLLLQTNPRNRPAANQLLLNPLVQMHFQESLEQSSPQTVQLLQTIKFDPRNVRALKKQLPKSNYELPELQHSERTEIDSLRGGIMSCKAARKNNSYDEGDRKLKEFIMKKKESEEKNRLQQIHKLQHEKQELMHHRERILSACGVRHRQHSDSPSVKRQEDVRKKIPKPNIPLNNNNISNRPYFPPKPSQGRIISNRSNASNRSIDKSKGQKGSNNQLQLKENMRKIGARIVSEKKIQRASSVRKVVYPNWWN